MTRWLHAPLATVFRCASCLYRARVARINLILSEELHARVIEEARSAGVSPTSWVREAIAWRIGRTEAQDEIRELRRRVARLEQAVKPRA